MPGLTPAGKIVADAVARYPKASHKSLTRMLYAKHPGTWPSRDACLTMVRRYRGRQGAKTRGQQAAQSTRQHWHTQEQCHARSENPFRSPPSAAVSWTPHKLTGSRLLVLADIHVPYHDPRALEPAVEWGDKHEPDTVILLGDFLDCHRLSKFEPDARARLFHEELQTARAMVKAIKAAIPRARVVYKLGNHDERLERYIAAKAPELLGVDEWSLKHLFRGLGLTIVGEKRVMVAGRLNLIHGHEYKGGCASPVNPARGLFLRAKACSMCGHQHQSSTHDETNIEGNVVGTWSVGCLCHLHPQYMPLNRWTHGVAMVDVDQATGWFEATNRKIIHGRVV